MNTNIKFWVKSENHLPNRKFSKFPPKNHKATINNKKKIHGKVFLALYKYISTLYKYKSGIMDVYQELLED